MTSDTYARLCDRFILFLYSPLLMVTAGMETRQAHFIRDHRTRGEEFDDDPEEWEQIDEEIDHEGDGWAKKVEESRPNVETDEAVLEIQSLKAEIQGLKAWLRAERMGFSGDI